MRELDIQSIKITVHRFGAMTSIRHVQQHRQDENQR